jgi:hypothetical protein
MRRYLPLAMLLALAARHASAQQLATPIVDTVNHHVVRVTSSGPTAWADTNGWKLVYERTVQPADGDRNMFGNPSDVHLLPDGRLVEVEDPRAIGVPIIRLFGARGEFVRTLGRDGEGPGEYLTLQTAMWHDTLVIQDQRLARTTFMTLDGKPLRSFRSVCCASGLPIGIDDHGRVQVQGGGGALFRYSADGKLIDSMALPRAVVPRVWHTADNATYSIPLAARNVFGWLTDGSIVYGGTDNERFMITRDGIDTTRIFGRVDMPPVRMRPSLRDSLFRLFDQNKQLRPIIKRDDIPESLPAWDGIHQDPAGNFWVTLGDGFFNRVRGFDIFAADGRYLGAVASPSSAPRAISWSGDHVAILDVDASDFPRVRIYRIDKRGH